MSNEKPPFQTPDFDDVPTVNIEVYHDLSMEFLSTTKAERDAARAKIQAEYEADPTQVGGNVLKLLSGFLKKAVN